MPALSRLPAGQGSSNSGSEVAARRVQSLAEAPTALGAVVLPRGACVPCFCLGLPASVTRALHAGMQVCAELVAPTRACLLPPSLRQELATGPQVPFAGGQAKWHWICFCSLLRVAWCGRGLGSLGAAWRGGLCSLVLCPSQACECGDTSTGVVCVAWGGEVGTCRLSPHPPVLLQAVCVSQ